MISEIAIVILCVIVSSVAILTFLSLHRTNTVLFTMLTSPKPGSTLVPQPYLTYVDTMKFLDKFIVNTFQRVYTTEVLPSMMNGDGEVALLAPNDKSYARYIEMFTLQSFENIPQYLRKSIDYYFDVKSSSDVNDRGIAILTKYIASKSKALLDNQLIQNIEKIERTGANPKSFVNATKSAGKAAKAGATPDGMAPKEM